MKQLITAKINVNKIDKERLFKGEKGNYLSLTIFVSDEPDQYGNDVSIEQSTDKGENKIFLGGGKVYKPKSEKVQSAPKKEETTDDLPF